MKRGFWATVIGFIATLLGAFYIRGNVHKGKAEQATRQRDQARSNVRSTEQRQADSQRTQQAVHQQQQENREQERKRHETPPDQRRTGRFGSADRLRDDP